MSLMKHLSRLRAINSAATEVNQKILEEADKKHEIALVMRDEAAKQADTLNRTDRRNHYSESLTKAFRGRTA